MNGFVDGAEHSTLKELCGAHTQWEENMKQADSLLCLARGHGKPFCACALCMEAEKLSCETKVKSLCFSVSGLGSLIVCSRR
ncbi:hypothetical protein QTP86_016669 [Hemibagrus guttatus]|nr:hypothetical protein QTP86_016669 [Hemibagrus guttatus]